MADWTVPETRATWMIFTGFARRLDDGSIEMTAKGAAHTLDYLRRQDPAASREDQAACDFCGQTEGHSKRCSVTKLGVNPKPPYTNASRENHEEDR